MYAEPATGTLAAKRVAERREDAGEPGQHHRDHDSWPRVRGGRLTGENEDPRPDDRADPQHDELAGTEDAPEATGAFLAQLLAGDLLDRFGLEDGHARSLARPRLSGVLKEVNCPQESFKFFLSRDNMRFF